jgi:AAA+ ATPase superfamily predicted ATPase
MSKQRTNKFIGRKTELAELERFTKKKSASFIVVRGRRRIGKSRLIEEFGKNFDKFYSFIGLAPEKNVTRQHQLETFSLQIAQQFKAPRARYDDWSDALWAVGEQVKSGKILLLFDEISWMGSQDPTFLGKIKNFWDQHLKKNDQLIFIVCGSASSWIEKNILSSTGFLGRISYTLTLEEVSLHECALFWGAGSKRIAAYEKLKILAVTGGVPKYLEEIDFKLSAEENIKNICFKKGGFLVNEFNNIFSDLFLRNSALYREIVQTLVSGSKEPLDICKALNIEQTGRFSEYLEELELAGFIKRDYAWHLESGHDSKLSKYRLSDNYLRFYLKYIDKYQTKIARNSFSVKSISSLPELQTIIGLQFENLVLNNRKEIHKILGLRAEEIVCENPYFQRMTKSQQGCQIDYMIQTKFNTLYLCEIKFSKNPVDTKVIDEVNQKIDRLKIPRAYSIRPVLIHVNGVENDIEESDFFTAIINFGSFLDIS